MIWVHFNIGLAILNVAVFCMTGNPFSLIVAIFCAYMAYVNKKINDIRKTFKKDD